MFERCFLCVLVSLAGWPAQAVELLSPDGRIKLEVGLENVGEERGCPVYRVSFRGKPLIASSRLGMTLADGVSLRSGFTITENGTSKHDGAWKPVYGERSSVRDQYREMTLKLASEAHPGHAVGLTFRCYDAGVAFRYAISRDGADAGLSITSEQSEFRFSADHTVWSTTSAQGKYRKLPLSKLGGDEERPMTVKVDDTTYVALGEASLVDHTRMKFAGLKVGHGVVSRLSGPVQAVGPVTTPWRVIMMGESPGTLLENNDLFLNLNAPCAIADTSWIKPGKVIREVTLTTTGAKACVDFAARRGLQYVEFDAGWYGSEYDDASDATTVTLDPKRSRGPLDLPEAIRYAEENGIGVILYVNRRALEKQLGEVLPLYKKWGVKGLKYGFVRVGSQEWTSWLHEAVRKAAAHGLMVDVHDEYRPTGYSRTYPNFMTQEGIRGDETRPSNELTLTILFTRMLAGAGDNTICYYAPEVAQLRTHGCQLAKAVCLYSPWQFLYWYDRPMGKAGGRGGVIGDDPELEFFDHVPTVWDDTKVLHGSIGEYAVLARRSGAEWFVGAMNNGTPRELEVKLEFLEPGKHHEATIYRDDPTLKTATKVRTERRIVTRETVLRVKLLANGGEAIRITPEEGAEDAEGASVD